jgi:hypothetical protein
MRDFVNISVLKSSLCRAWWYTPLIPALGSQKQAWSTEWVPGQPGLHRETLSPKKKKKKKRGRGKRIRSLKSSLATLQVWLAWTTWNPVYTHTLPCSTCEAFVWGHTSYRRAQIQTILCLYVATVKRQVGFGGFQPSLRKPFVVRAAPEWTLRGCWWSRQMSLCLTHQRRVSLLGLSCAYPLLDIAAILLQGSAPCPASYHEKGSWWCCGILSPSSISQFLQMPQEWLGPSMCQASVQMLVCLIMICTLTL